MSESDPIVYLNGKQLPLSQAHISPLDRGFLFGDGVYEVIPAQERRLVGFDAHMQRLEQGLAALNIPSSTTAAQWRVLFEQLLAANPSIAFPGVYLHISRGQDSVRSHVVKGKTLTPTVFCYVFAMPAPPLADSAKVNGLSLQSAEDKRWRRCHIKSTALLGNVLHLQQAVDNGMQETLLYSAQGLITEAAACNVFVVKNGVVYTPPLDHQLLPGITRHMVIRILNAHSQIQLQEQPVSLEFARQADEIWLTSASKEIAPVTELDSQPVGEGVPGPVWQQAQQLFSQHKYDY